MTPRRIDSRRVTRRDFLSLLGAGTGLALATACGQQAPLRRQANRGTGGEADRGPEANDRASRSGGGWPPANHRAGLPDRRRPLRRPRPPRPRRRQQPSDS